VIDRCPTFQWSGRAARAAHRGVAIVAIDYPERLMAPDLVRYSCMIFGLATIGSSIAYAPRQDLFMLVGGLLVGGGWFAFGKYGGLPLVDTAADWRPPAYSRSC
jgi:hypothetical protein